MANCKLRYISLSFYMLCKPIALLWSGSNCLIWCLVGVNIFYTYKSSTYLNLFDPWYGVGNRILVSKRCWVNGYNTNVIANRFSTGVAICFIFYKVAVDPGHPARSKCPATVALSSFRDSRKLAFGSNSSAV